MIYWLLNFLDGGWSLDIDIDLDVHAAWLWTGRIVCVWVCVTAVFGVCDLFVVYV